MLKMLRTNKKLLAKNRNRNSTALSANTLSLFAILSVAFCTNCSAQKTPQEPVSVEHRVPLPNDQAYLNGPYKKSYANGRHVFSWIGELMSKHYEGKLNFIYRYVGTPAPIKVPGMVCLNGELTYCLDVDTFYHRISLNNNLWYFLQDGFLIQDALYKDGKLMNARHYPEGRVKHVNRKIDSTGTSYIIDDYGDTLCYRRRVFSKDYVLKQEIWYPNAKLSLSSCHVLFKEVLIGKSYFQPVMLISHHKKAINISTDNKSQYKFSLDSINVPLSVNARIKPGDTLTLYLHYSPKAKTFTDLAMVSLNTNLPDQPKLDFYLEVTGGHFNRSTLADTTTKVIDYNDSLIVIPNYSPEASISLKYSGGGEHRTWMDTEFIRKLEMPQHLGEYNLIMSGCGFDVRKKVLIVNDK